MDIVYLELSTARVHGAKESAIEALALIRCNMRLRYEILDPADGWVIFGVVFCVFIYLYLFLLCYFRSLSIYVCK